MKLLLAALTLLVLATTAYAQAQIPIVAPTFCTTTCGSGVCQTICTGGGR